MQVMLGMDKDDQIDFKRLVELIGESAAIGDSIRLKSDGMAEGIITRMVAHVQTNRVRSTRCMEAGFTYSTHARCPRRANGNPRGSLPLRLALRLSAGRRGGRVSRCRLEQEWDA